MMLGESLCESCVSIFIADRSVVAVIKSWYVNEWLSGIWPYMAMGLSARIIQVSFIQTYSSCISKTLAEMNIPWCFYILMAQQTECSKLTMKTGRQRTPLLFDVDRRQRTMRDTCSKTCIAFHQMKNWTTEFL